MSSVVLSPTQIIPALHGNKINVNIEVADCEFTQINTNKQPQGVLIQDGMANEVINLDDYKKEKQPFEDLLPKNVASEDLPTLIKGVEWVVPNNIRHEKKTLDDSVSQLIMALQSPIRVKTKDIPNIIPKDKTDGSTSTDIDNYYNATQYFTKNYKEKSNVSLVVASNADGDDVLCFVDSNVKNIKDKNGSTYLPHQEKNDLVSASVATLTNLSDSSDEESSPKRSKLFTFTDSDFPDSDEIHDELMKFPKPTVISESEYSSEDESNWFLLHCREETKPVTKVDLTKMIGTEKLPERVMTRKRISNVKLQSCDELSKKQSARMFQSSYLKQQEVQMDEDIIIENIKRVRSFKKTQSKNYESIKEEKQEITSPKKGGNKNNEHPKKLQVKIKKPVRNDAKTKSKSKARKCDKSEKKNTKVNSLDSISAAKTTTRRTRSMKNESSGNKPDNKRKIASKKERSTSPEIEGRRSKRQQQAKEKNDYPMNVPKSILKKSIHEQSTAYNISFSSSRTPKSLKRSLVDDSDVPNPKRTRSYNTNNNNSINNASLRATPARVTKAQRIRHTVFPSKELGQDKLGSHVYMERREPAQKRFKILNSKRNFLNIKTRSQSARRYHRACKRTRQTQPVRTSTKRL